MRETHKEQKLREKRRLGELENRKASEEAREAFERKPYSVCDFLSKVGINLKGDAAGGDHKGAARDVQK